MKPVTGYTRGGTAPGDRATDRPATALSATMPAVNAEQAGDTPGGGGDDPAVAAAPARTRTLPKPASTPEREEVRRLLREYAAHRDPAVRERLVELNSDLVRFIARRFANRGEPLEDIEQVGFLGLIQAIERFDPSLENEFSTFATPTIMGEIRRHFRDRSWSIRVPRRLQENYTRAMRAQEQLSQELGRQPSVAEIAARLGLETDEVLAALEVSPAQHTVSLDATRPGRDEEEGSELGERLGQEDDNLERVEMKALIEQAMAHLSPRERQIMLLRFVDQLPQTEVAKRLGISQMHVSRLQRAALERMRREFPEPPPV
ncbi:MAG: SigB/SigF/SigG family RNA polymerase sigma factor [Chloroflexi bacterium]|nr:MAG: SigB/SigF/SigG family RNA polymerase sigma factor [Chloroflexota bacterium]